MINPRCSCATPIYSEYLCTSHSDYNCQLAWLNPLLQISHPSSVSNRCPHEFKVLGREKVFVFNSRWPNAGIARTFNLSTKQPDELPNHHGIRTSAQENSCQKGLSRFTRFGFYNEFFVRNFVLQLLDPLEIIGDVTLGDAMRYHFISEADQKIRNIISLDFSDFCIRRSRLEEL